MAGLALVYCKRVRGKKIWAKCAVSTCCLISARPASPYYLPFSPSQYDRNSSRWEFWKSEKWPNQKKETGQWKSVYVLNTQCRVQSIWKFVYLGKITKSGCMILSRKIYVEENVIITESYINLWTLPQKGIHTVRQASHLLRQTYLKSFGRQTDNYDSPPK